jgi:ATP-dependent RNA helicase RhlE
LVATDIAARGIDVEELSHVINFELPNVPETYVHRIGRTGRAGANGISLSFCDEEEKEYLRDIHKLIQKTIPVVEDQPYHMTHVGMPRQQPQQRQRSSFNKRDNSSFRNSSKQWSSDRRAKRN